MMSARRKPQPSPESETQSESGMGARSSQPQPGGVGGGQRSQRRRPQAATPQEMGAKYLGMRPLLGSPEQGQEMGAMPAMRPPRPPMGGMGQPGGGFQMPADTSGAEPGGIAGSVDPGIPMMQKLLAILQQGQGGQGSLG